MLDHWDDLDAKQQEDFRAELTALDLKEESQCGAVVKSSDRGLASYANASYEEISKGEVGFPALGRWTGHSPGHQLPKRHVQRGPAQQEDSVPAPG